jgi:Leucine-rich repeat (LRR) protein
MKTKQNIKSGLMKNSLLLLLLFTGMANAQIVNIPDAHLKTALVTASADLQNLLAYNAGGSMVPVDANGDGEIQYSEAAQIVGLQLGGLFMLDLAFSDYTGLEAFVNLNALDISNNPIGSIDTSILPNGLVGFGCQNCGLTTIDISPLPNLVGFDCAKNSLISIDVANRPLLQSFSCDENALTSLDLSGCTGLYSVSCSHNPLPSVDLSDSSNLRYYYCMGNQFATLDISGFPLLEELYCDNNQITSINFGSIVGLKTLYTRSNPLVSNLDVSQFPNLRMLACRSNNQTAIDVSHNTNLSFLDCAGNSITAVDVSMLANLTQLDCSLNPITTLDVSSLTLLNLLYCHDTTIETMFIKNGMAEDLNLTNNPNLVYVCADDNQVDYIQGLLGSGVVVNSYCSFMPGGNYNTITGNIKYDADNNGCDPTDIIPANLRVDINDGTQTGASFSNAAGQYTFFTQAGNFDITPAFENPAWFNFSPAAATIPFANANNNTVVQDFCITSNGIHPDVEVVIAPITPARPGFDATYRIVYRNKGNQILSGNITFTYNNATLDFINAVPGPDTQSTGLLNWNYINLQPFESRSITVALHVNTPVDTPSVHIGDVLSFEATITPVIDDEFPADNLFVFNQTVVGSYDLNNIACIEGAVVAPSEIGNYLHYVINFENTGTFPAENIVVKTIVDTSKFNVDSLQLMIASAAVDARITGNKVEFIFKNINLEIGGHGHILLKIKTNSTLVTGDAVSNRGDIFFDYNAPVDTGFANTVFQTLSNTGFETDSSVVVSPNPASNEVLIKADDRIKSIQLYDVQGRIIVASLVNDSTSKLDISGYSKGIYFIKITTEKGTKVQKLLKE